MAGGQSLPCGGGHTWKTVLTWWTNMWRAGRKNLVPWIWESSVAEVIVVSHYPLNITFPQLIKFIRVIAGGKKRLRNVPWLAKAGPCYIGRKRRRRPRSASCHCSTGLGHRWRPGVDNCTNCIFRSSALASSNSPGGACSRKFVTTCTCING